MGFAAAASREKIQAAGSEPVGGTPAELARFLTAEIASLGKAAAAAGSKAE